MGSYRYRSLIEAYNTPLIDALHTLNSPPVASFNGSLQVRFGVFGALEIGFMSRLLRVRP